MLDKKQEMIDTVNGATSSAIIYSIAETAKANQLKPYEYFEYLLTEIPKHMDNKNSMAAEAAWYFSRYLGSTVFLNSIMVSLCSESHIERVKYIGQKKFLWRNAEREIDFQNEYEKI